MPQGPVAYLPPPPVYSWTGFYIGINGGGAFGNSNFKDPVFGDSGSFNIGGALAAAGGLPFQSSTQVGWTGGAGIEYAINSNWSAKVEYLYVGLPNASCGLGSCGSSTTSVALNENIVRGGFNFKFGGPSGFGFGW